MSGIDKLEAAVETVELQNGIVKHCTRCARSFSVIDWKLLDFRGYFMDDAPADPDHPEYGEPQGRCEMRNCDCGTTLMVSCSALEMK